MRLEGWNDDPPGAGAVFDRASAPRWLSLLWRLPLVDRFAYPQLVARGQGYLAVHDPAVFDAQDALARGWKILPEGYEPPRSRAPLTSPEGPAH